MVVTHLVGCGWACSHQSSSRRITLQCGECCEGLVVGVQVGVKAKSQQEPCAHRQTDRHTAGLVMLGLVQTASQCVAVGLPEAASGCWRTAGWHCVHVSCCAPGCKQPHSPASGTASKSDWKSASSRGSVPLQDSTHTAHTHTHHTHNSKLGSEITLRMLLGTAHVGVPLAYWSQAAVNEARPATSANCACSHNSMLKDSYNNSNLHACTAPESQDDGHP